MTMHLWQTYETGNNRMYTGLSSCKVPAAPLQQNNVCLLIAFFKRTIWLDSKQRTLTERVLCSCSLFQSVAVKHHTKADRINK